MKKSLQTGSFRARAMPARGAADELARDELARTSSRRWRPPMAPADGRRARGNGRELAPILAPADGAARDELARQVGGTGAYRWRPRDGRELMRRALAGAELYPWPMACPRDGRAYVPAYGRELGRQGYAPGVGARVGAELMRRALAACQVGARVGARIGTGARRRPLMSPQ